MNRGLQIFCLSIAGVLVTIGCWLIAAGNTLGLLPFSLGCLMRFSAPERYALTLTQIIAFLLVPASFAVVQIFVAKSSWPSVQFIQWSWIWLGHIFLFVLDMRAFEIAARSDTGASS